MINKLEEKSYCKCKVCKNSLAKYKVLNNKLCQDCFYSLYNQIGQEIIPKSPVSVLKKNNIIKIEKF